MLPSSAENPTATAGTEVGDEQSISASIDSSESESAPDDQNLETKSAPWTGFGFWLNTAANLMIRDKASRPSDRRCATSSTISFSLAT